ncbi:MAG: hypothetical protein JWN41_312 [Thermoleophilia bacterium]|nr:hypothetical protein [Thermoleophilia bacterium]
MSRARTVLGETIGSISALTDIGDTAATVDCLRRAAADVRFAASEVHGAASERLLGNFNRGSQFWAEANRSGTLLNDLADDVPAVVDGASAAETALESVRALRASLTSIELR